MQELFRIASEEPDRQWSVSVSVLEVYNEAVRDLLALAALGAGGGGGGSGGKGSGPPSAAAAAACTLEVSALGAGELPASMDRCGAACLTAS